MEIPVHCFYCEIPITGTARTLRVHNAVGKLYMKIPVHDACYWACARLLQALLIERKYGAEESIDVTQSPEGTDTEPGAVPGGSTT